MKIHSIIYSKTNSFVVKIKSNGWQLFLNFSGKDFIVLFLSNNPKIPHDLKLYYI